MRGLDLAQASLALEARTPEQRLAYAVERFGDRLLFTSSFGAGSGVLLHMWSKVAPRLPVVLLDTGFLFEETHAYKDQLARDLGLDVRVVQPAVSRADFLAAHGQDVMAREPDFCCAQNKVLPLAPHLERAEAWVSGLRRDQSKTRGDTPILLATEGGPIKIHPLATMTSAEAAEYMRANGVPEHPLVGRRFLSIGCEPCTRPVADGQDERAGRWAGTEKTECGLHTRARRAG